MAFNLASFSYGIYNKPQPFDGYVKGMGDLMDYSNPSDYNMYERPWILALYSSMQIAAKQVPNGRTDLPQLLQDMLGRCSIVKQGGKYKDHDFFNNSCALVTQLERKINDYFGGQAIFLSTPKPAYYMDQNAITGTWGRVATYYVDYPRVDNGDWAPNDVALQIWRYQQSLATSNLGEPQFIDITEAGAISQGRSDSLFWMDLDGIVSRWRRKVDPGYDTYIAALFRANAGFHLIDALPILMVAGAFAAAALSVSAAASTGAAASAGGSGAEAAGATAGGAASGSDAATQALIESATENPALLSQSTQAALQQAGYVVSDGAGGVVSGSSTGDVTTGAGRVGTGPDLVSDGGGGVTSASGSTPGSSLLQDAGSAVKSGYGIVKSGLSIYSTIGTLESILNPKKRPPVSLEPGAPQTVAPLQQPQTGLVLSQNTVIAGAAILLLVALTRRE